MNHWTNHITALFLLLFLLSGKAFSSPNITETTTYYSVEPQSISEMYQVFMRSSPIQKEGKTYLGTTKWKVWWVWKWKYKNNRCRMKSVDAFVEIEYLMPKLAVKTYTADILFIWDKWFPRLEHHEQNHAKYAVETAKVGQKEIMNIPSERKCEQLNASAELLSEELVKKLRKKNRLYDMRTIHGRTEGADLKEYM